MEFVFGPVSSRRFGISLGVDLSPDKKRCNFDCLYCELKAAKPVNFFDNPAAPETIVNEVIEKLKSCSPDVLAITANGEPTLYPFLDRLIDLLLAVKERPKLMILSNSSTIGDQKISNAIAKLDIVKLSLDSALTKSFKKVDRAIAPIEINEIIEAIAAFKRRFSQFLTIEVLLVANVNDSDADFDALNAALRYINPDRIDIGTIDRPSAYKVSAVANETMQVLADRLNGLNTQIIPNKRAIAKQSFSENELINLLKRRSLSLNEAKAILDEKSLTLLDELAKTDKAKITIKTETPFYTLNAF
ncbi:radical SAM protein [Campylobacterota bacterium]|nr:radical SAM protein [Campylobacterota bacterium]